MSIFCEANKRVHSCEANKRVQRLKDDPEITHEVAHPTQAVGIVKGIVYYTACVQVHVVSALAASKGGV